MDISTSRKEQVVQMIHALGTPRFAIRDLQCRAQHEGISYRHLKNLLQVLEKEDILVRVQRGVYTTMDHYRAASG